MGLGLVMGDVVSDVWDVARQRIKKISNNSFVTLEQLWGEIVPFRKLKVRVSGIQARDEVVPPCLDVSFCGVAPVVMRGDSLEVN